MEIVGLTRIFFIILVLTSCCSGLPKSFDVRLEHPKCSIVLDQGLCGGCWAFSASQALGNRLCIANGGKSVLLSPQHTLDCVEECHGCNGGSALSAYLHFQSGGVDRLSCTPYTSGKSKSSDSSCPVACHNTDEKLELFRAKKVYSLKGDTIEHTVHNMMTDLVNNGPISASMLIYSDFFTFFHKNRSGIYTQGEKGIYKGGHSVKIIGYGTSEDNVDFWVVANSWGSSFADNGYFKIRRGTDEASIESRQISAALPALPSQIQNQTLPEYARDFTEDELGIVDGSFEEHEVNDNILDLFEKSTVSLGMGQAKLKKVYSQVASGVNYKFVFESSGSLNARLSTSSLRSIVIHSPHSTYIV